MITTKDGFSCSICNKKYRQKINYDRHKYYCEFLSKTKKEKNNELDVSQEDTPSLLDLYKLFQDFALRTETRMDNLEKQMAKIAQLQKRKINILDWLNGEAQKKPEITFSTWMNQQIIPVVSNHLESVFQNDLLTGITQLFETAISSTDVLLLPICCFENKPNNIYIYKKANSDVTDTERVWVHIMNSDFDTYLSILSNQFLVDFNKNWFSKYKEKIEVDEKYKEMYILYYKNVLGGDRMTEESRNHRIRQHLFRLLKRSVKTITEFDIV